MSEQRYTFEDFKREHPAHLVEKFLKASDYKPGRQDYVKSRNNWRSLSSFVSCAFPWRDTPEGHDFWSDVAEGKHKIIKT